MIVSHLHRDFRSVLTALCAFWSMCCVCGFLFISSAQSQPLRLLQPSKGERLTPGGEYLIIWTGVSPIDTIQISFSTNGGRTWQVITATATGNAYRWKPIPQTVSDSCLLLLNTKPRDGSRIIESNAFGIRYGLERPSKRWLNRWAGYNFEATKILTIASLPRDDSARQTYRTEVFDAQSGKTLFTLPDVLADTVLRFAPTTHTAQTLVQQWSPDNKFLVNVLDDTNFGIFDATSGALMRRIAIPRDGSRTALQSVVWSQDGKEIIARVLHRVQGAGAAGTIVEDRFVRFNPNDPFDRPLGSSAAMIEFDGFGSTYLGLLPNQRQWLSVKRNATNARIQEIILHTIGSDTVRRFLPPNDYSWDISSLITSPNSLLAAVVAVPQNPNLQNLLNIITLQDGFKRTAVGIRPISWSPDSRKLIVQNINKVQPEVFDIEAFQAVSPLQNFFAPTAPQTSLSEGYIISATTIGNAGIYWMNSGQRILGYETQTQQNLKTTQTLGFWNTETGCQIERFTLPRYGNMALPLAYRLSDVGTLTNNSAERQFIISNNATDTALVLTLPQSQSPPPACQTAVSDGFWSLRFPNLLLAPETVTIPNLVCETTATARFVVMNLTAGALVLTSTLQTLSLDSSEPSEFTLEQTISPVMRGGASETVIVRYSPQGFGNKSVQVTVSDIARNVLARTLILAGRDSLRIDPPAPNVNLGLLPAKTVAITTVTVRNSGNTPLVWSTAATRSSEGNIFIMSVSPNPTPIGASAQVQLRIQPIESPQNFRETLPIYFCGSSTSTAFVQARVLREFPEIDVPALIDAGTLTCETSVQRTIRIQNLGGLPLVINNLTTPTDTLTILGAPTLPLRILPLDSALITVRMSHSGNGVRESKLTIQSNDPQRPLVDVVVRLQRQPPRYTWTPALFRFDRIDIGQTAEQVIEFTNNSQNPYLWTGLPRALTPDFTILSAQPNPTPNGGTSRLTIRFNGSRESGLISTLATLRLDDVCRTETQLGLEAITIQPAPKLVIRSRIPFDTLLCQTDRTESVEMLNAGRATLRVDSLYVETSIGAGRSMMADFAVQNVGATALPIRVAGVDVATSSFRFDLQFRPRSSGLRTNWLVIHSNDTTTNLNGITRVVLTGFNATASFSLSPPILRFPVPSDFATVRDTVLITNTGTQTLQWQGFPRVIDSLFTIERVTPTSTAPGAVSKAVVRFSGIRTTDDINREITLTNPLCNAAQRIRFLAGTVPQAALGEVLPLNFRLLCESEREQALVLENIGNAELLLTQEPRFLNDTLQEARILSAPRSIPAGARANITLLIRPQRTGTRTLRLLITSNDLLTPSREVAIAFTKDSSALAIVPPTLDVGDVSNGVLQAQRFVIENRGTLSQRISTPFQASNITVDSLVPNPIPAGTRATAYIRFAPGTSTTVNGVFTGSLAVQDSCARVSRFTVTARLTDGVVVLPDSVQLPPLGEADMPIFLRRRSGVVVGTNASFTVRIANTSLVQVLSPLQAAQGVVQNRVENGARIIRFSVNVPSEQDTVPLVVMRLRGLLGNDSVTTITADSAFVGATPIRGSVSRFRTLGLNYSGGKPRLYYSPTIRLIAPNPASEEISVKIDAAESADAILRLVNVLGQGLTLFTGRLSAGEQDFHFPLSAIPTGTYILELRSISLSGQPAASERSTMHLHIVR